MSNPAYGLNVQCLLGMRCDQFTVLAADQNDIQSIVIMKDDVDKLHVVSPNMAMGVIGAAGDAARFAHFVSCNVQLHRLRGGHALPCHAVAHFTRRALADTLTTQSPTLVNMLLGGFEERADGGGGGQLYALDVAASCVPVSCAARGFGGLLALSIMDKYHKPTLSEAEAYEVLKLCVREIHQRLVVNLRNFHVKVVSRRGVCSLPAITPATFICND